MKRSRIQRKKPMRTKRKPKARRDAKLAREYGSPGRIAWISQQPCEACGQGPCQNAHVKSRGAGGGWADVIPLCQGCHARQHHVGILAFAAVANLDLEAAARKHRQQAVALGLV